MRARSSIGRGQLFAVDDASGLSWHLEPNANEGVSPRPRRAQALEGRPKDKQTDSKSVMFYGFSASGLRTGSDALICCDDIHGGAQRSEWIACAPH